MSPSFCCHRFRLRWICLQNATLQPGDIYIFFSSYISKYTGIIQQHKLICPIRFKGKNQSTHILNVLQNRGATGNTWSSKAATHHCLLGFLPNGTPASLTYRCNVRKLTCSSFSLNCARSCGRAAAASVSHSDWAAWIAPCNTNKYINNKWRDTEWNVIRGQKPSRNLKLFLK